MGYKAADLIGKVFGDLTVVEAAPKRAKNVAWYCRCICGKIVWVTTGNLNAGSPTSCGCKYKHAVAQLSRERATTHGWSNHPLYTIWSKMLYRCENKASKDYPNYGGRGITAHWAWHDFPTFVRDMGPRPSLAHSVERLDNNGPYCKDNCVWGTRKQQANNRRQGRARHG